MSRPDFLSSLFNEENKMSGNNIKPQRCSDIKLYPPRYKFTWRVDNFTKICPQGTMSFPEIKAPHFTTRTKNNIKMEWEVTIAGSGGMMYCTLSQKSLDWENDQKKLLGFGCTVQTFLGNLENPSCYEAGSRSFKFPSKLENSRHSLVSIDSLYQKREMLLKDDTLYFYLHAQITSPDGVKLPLHFHQEDDARMHKLISDFQKLLDSRRNCDCEVKCEQSTFYCHRIILSARSKVFSNMLDTDRGLNSVVNIDDMKPPAVAALLKYIYTGIVDPPLEFGGWTRLIQSAEKFELKEMKDYCFNQMFEHLSDENVGWLAVAAHTYDADEQFKDSIKTYCKTHIAKLLEISSFRELFSKHIDAFY